MNPTTHLFTFINQTMHLHWDEPAFTDYGQPLKYTYGDVAYVIARLGIFYGEIDINPGDKIAIVGGNCSNWGVSLFSILAHGAVAVPILQDFTGKDIEYLIDHSDAKLLIASSAVLKKIHPERTKLKAVLNMKDFSLAYHTDETILRSWEYNEFSFSQYYPYGFFDADDAKYRDDNLDDLAIINYTSGTTSSPKGVMLTYRNLSSNITYYRDGMPTHPGMNVVSVLPLAHMYGMMFELMCQFCFGAHVIFMTRLSTNLLMNAYKKYQPHLIVLVPMVLEKIYDKRIEPAINQPFIHRMWNIPGVGMLLKKQIRHSLLNFFGGKVRSVIIGGAGISPEVEGFLMDIRFPFLVGYGMTECAPLVGYIPWQKFKAGSCGKLVDRMELRIDSAKNEQCKGEILVKGEACMIGYYKNDEATRNAFTKDGWMHTGDLGSIDKEGFIYLRGRCKTMILGPSGQNIYPEEIETILNRDKLVQECLIVSRENKLVALIVPSLEIMNESADDNYFDMLVSKTNKRLPVYSQICGIEIRTKEFEKTPKHSIKRFMYQ